MSGMARAVCVLLAISSSCFLTPRLGRTAARAVGYFPGADVEEKPLASRGGLVERLSGLPELGVEEHTEELRLLREQTAILAQELRLLKEILQDGALEDVIAGAPVEQHSLPGAASQGQEVLAMTDLLASSASFRHGAALDALKHLSKRVIERRVEGELPLGQVPSQ